MTERVKFFIAGRCYWEDEERKNKIFVIAGPHFQEEPGVVYVAAQDRLLRLERLLGKSYGYYKLSSDLTKALNRYPSTITEEYPAKVRLAPNQQEAVVAAIKRQDSWTGEVAEQNKILLPQDWMVQHEKSGTT